ncbi:MAG: hypothetical protein EHM61_02315 [Acidobacteria bacterium]|nr:MAG: hypothetical protein EHM61_02315 [Acidobacteriota bacterium]
MRGDTQTVQIQEIRPDRRTWTVTIYDDYLRFVADAGSGSFDVERAQAEQEVQLRAPLFGTPGLTVQQGRKLCFNLDRKHFSALKAWLGPPTGRSLRAALKQQLGWGIGVGIFLIISSLPKPADPDAELDALPFDPVAGALGTSLIFLRLLSWALPCRQLFLADAAWFLVLGAKVAYGVLSGSSGIWLVVTLLCVIAAIGGFEKYHEFRDLAEDHPQSPARVNGAT